MTNVGKIPNNDKKKIPKNNLVKPKNKEKIAKNPAPSKIPQKQWWKLIIKILLLLIWVAAAVIVSQLIVGYLMLWILGREVFIQTVPTAIYSVLSYILAFCWVLFVTPKIVIKLEIISKFKGNKRNIDNRIESKAINRKELGISGTPTWTDIGLAPVGFIAATLIAAGLVAIFNLFQWFDAEQVQEIGFSTYLVGFDRVLVFIILVVVAPIVEELIFRGWLYGKIRPMLSSKMSNTASMALSILLVSLLFGLVHMQWNVSVNVFALSVVLCGLREITGTIYAGILTHMVKNGVAFYLLYVLGIG